MTLVVGLGVTGEAVARRLAGAGAVTVVDDNPAAARFTERATALEALGVKVVGAPSRDDLAELVAAAELVVPSPGVPEAHPDWHPTFEDYVAAKARIFANQVGDDLLVFNADDAAVAGAAASAPARSMSFTLQNPGGGNRAAWRLEGGWLVRPDGAPLLAAAALPRRGPHDIANGLAAAAPAARLRGPHENPADGPRSVAGRPPPVAPAGPRH